MAEFAKIITVDCPHCESKEVIKKGQRNGYQRYECKDCRRKFSDSGNTFARWNKAEHIGAAVDMYYSGMSYKQIAELIGRNFDLPEPSKSTILSWVREYSDMAEIIVSNHPPQTSNHWVADEMVEKVGGQKMWHWNVMDRDTRYILASHLSPHRGETAAITVFERALKNNGGVIPETVTTDGLPSYQAALGLMLPPPNTHHIISDGIYEEVNNNLSERLQGTYRDRSKTMRGLQGQRSGQRYLDGFNIDYNHFRDHEAHRGGTPASAAKVDPNLKEWTDVVNAVSEYKAYTNRAKLKTKKSRRAERRAVVDDRSPTQKQSSSRGNNGRGQPLR